MTSYPDLRPSTTGHYPPRITDVPPGVPILGEQLMGAKGRDLLMGWVAPPASGVWRPEDLLWKPPGVKAFDIAGEIVDAEIFPAVDSHVWVTSQLRLRDRWLELLRQRVLTGTMKLNAALAAMLGLEFGDGVSLKNETGPQAELQRFEAMQRGGLH